MVDDDKTTLDLIYTYLSKHYKVITASSGEGACSMFTEEGEGKKALDLILMDIFLPNMSGIEAVEKIRIFETDKKLDPIPIIGMTALKSSPKGIRKYQNKKMPFTHLF